MILALENSKLKKRNWALTISVGLSVGFVLLFLVIAAIQFLYPYEIDWYEGIMLDHAMRVLEHKPIYSQPTIDFTAALYQPLYYYASAFFLKLGGIGYSSGRLLSILCSLGSTVLLSYLAYFFTQKKWSLWATAGLFLAANDLTGYTYTLCRVDSLMLFFLIAGTILLIRGSIPSIIGASLFFLLAFFTKQQAIFFIPCAVLWIFLNDWRKGLVFLGVLTLGIATITLLLQSATDGWYGHIVYYIPSVKSKTFGWLRTLTAIPYYFLRYWGIGLMLITLYVLSLKHQIFPYLKSKEGLILLMLVTSLAQAALHRGDQMSYMNVLLPLAAFIALYLVIVVANSSNDTSRVFQIGLAMQLAALIYNPKYEVLALPSKSDAYAAEQFLQKLKGIDGEVLMPNHSFIGRFAGKASHANSQTTWDFLVVNDWVAKKLKQDMEGAYANQRYSAIIVDKNPLATPDSIVGYTLSTTIDTLPLFGSRIGSSLTYPYYVYLPKRASK